jgi:hypothetical protein
LDAIKEDDKARKVCPQEVVDYEKDCARSWVSTDKCCAVSLMPVLHLLKPCLDQVL